MPSHEAEYYMQIANAQLQLAANPELARLALLQADERVLQLANPSLTNVRRALADELRALDSVRAPDIEGITLRLASLAAQADALPLRRDIRTEANESGGEEEPLSGMDRAIQSIKGTVENVVSVRRVDDEVRPLLAPEASYFLRTNLALQLQAARLALLQGDQTPFNKAWTMQAAG